MNYAALLGVLAAATFTLPLLARLAEALGLHRNAGVAVSLLVAGLTVVGWYVRASRVRARPTERADGAHAGRLGSGLVLEPPEEDDAGLQGHR